MAEDGTGVICKDDRLGAGALCDERVAADESDDDEFEEAAGVEVVVVVEGGTTWGKEVDTDVREVENEEFDEVRRGGALEEEFELYVLTVMAAVDLATLTAWEALFMGLDSDILAALSTLPCRMLEFEPVVRVTPELPGVTERLSVPTGGPRSCLSPEPLEPEFPLAEAIMSPIFPPPSRLDGLMLPPGGRPVLFFILGSRDSYADAFSSSDAPASRGTGRYGGMVLT